MIFKPLGTVAKIIAGQSPASSTYNSTGEGLPFFQGKADFQEMHPTVRMWCTSLKRKEAEPDDVLISVRAPVGAVNICNKKSIIGRGLSAIRPSSNLNGLFLYYFLKANERQLDALGTGSTFKAITQEILKRFEIPIPPFDDQKRIAHLLGKVEGLIARRKQHLQQLDDILKSVFLEMFGDYIKDKQETDLASYITTLTDYHANGSYETLRKNVELLTEPNFALMVRTTDLEKNNFSEGCNYITENAYNFLEKSKVFGGEIIVNKIGSAGKVYLMPHLNRPVSLGMNAFLIRFNKALNSVFAYYFLTSDIGTQRIHNLVQGAVTKTITKNAIRSIRIPIVHINLQNQFATVVEKIEGIKSRYQQSLTDLESLYGALSQKAFKGELDLSRVPLPTEGPEIAEDVKLEAEEKQPNKKRAGTINA